MENPQPITNQEIPWTQFWDMHSGGRTKEEPFEKIYIQAPEEEAKVIFYNRFGHNPERVSCTCCGDDYSISESKTFEQASAFHRDCEWDANAGEKGAYVEKVRTSKYAGANHKYQTAEEYMKNTDVLVIRHEDIKPEERIGSVPKQGYVWMDE
jgi:hypothetical protein